MIDHYVTQEEAIKLIKRSYRAGVTHFVRGGTFLYSNVEEQRGYNDMSCLIEVSQKSALKFVGDIFGRGDHFSHCKIKISLTCDDEGKYTGQCIFVG